MKREVYGRIDLSGHLILPLEEAHKIQLIVAKYGEQLGSVYRGKDSGGSVNYIADCPMPAVEVAERPYISAKGLDYKQLNAWRDMVSESEGGNFLSPQDFIKLSEDEQ